MTSPFLSSDNASLLSAIVDTLGHASPGLVVTGEPGLGKEAIVRLLYERSAFRGYPFVKVNCPMLSGGGPADDSPCFPDVTAHPNQSRISKRSFG